MFNFIARLCVGFAISIFSGLGFAAAPSAPTNLSLAVISQTQINLTWTDNATTETGYEVERRLSSQTTYSKVVTLGVNASSYNDTGLAEATKYYYRVRAVAGTTSSRYSSTPNATTLASLPAAPSGLSTTSITSTKVSLVWVDNASNETAHKVERKTGSTGTYSEIASIGANATTYTSSGLVEGTEYFFRVRSSNSTGSSAYSVEIKAKTTVSPPKTPSGLTLSPSTNQMSLSWTDGATNETGFEVERKTGGGGSYALIYTTTANQTTLTDSGLVEGTLYYYRVRAVNSGGTSSYSTTSSTTLIWAPSTLVAAPVTLSLNPFEVTLTWADNSSGESGYLVEEALASAGPWTQVAKLDTNVAAYTRGKLSASTTYYYRVRAYVGAANSAYSPTATVKTVAKRTSLTSAPRGIYLLSDNSGTDGLGSLSSANKSFVDGFAWRVSWGALDKGVTAPNYDFSSVGDAVTGVQAINKKLTIALIVLSVPQYVLDGATQTWLAPGTQRGTTVNTPVPWDAASMTHFRNFLTALASYEVFDTVSGKMKPLRDHPALGQFNAAILGMQSIRDNSGELVTLPGFSRDTIKQATRDSIHAAVDQFPAKTNYVAFWGLDDGAQPDLGDELMVMIMDEFDGVKNPLIGFFNEALKGDSPGASPYQSASLNGYPMLLQACGAWLTHDPCTWTAGDNSPANGFSYGSLTFGAKYYEIYREDIEEPSFQSAFTTWQPLLNAN